jgi:tetratricopeptide (TPR) repeat protein
MRMLIHDRYIVTGPGRARDLATGGELPVESIEATGTTRLLPALEPLFEALDHGREGDPQWRTVHARDPVEARTLAEAVALGAQRRGYVPVAVGLYAQASRQLAEELRDRAVVLIDVDDLGTEATASFLSASAASARPHMLVTFRQPRRAPSVVREARAVFGGAAALESPAAHPEVTRLLARAARASEFVLSGRHAAAERLLREVSAALERRRAFGEAAKVALDLGRILFERGRVGEADACAGQAARLADVIRDAALTCEAHLLQAWSRIEQVRVAEAESISRAVLLCAPGEALSTCARATLARCLLEQGRVRELLAVDVGAGEGVAGVEGIWRAIVHDVAVAVLVETQRLFEAGARIRRALDTWGDSDPLAAAILHTAHLRVILSTGDLGLARGVLQRALDAAGRARVPLRALRARAVWLAGLTCAGSAELAGRERARFRRLLSVAPPMLVREVEAACRHSVPSHGVSSTQRDTGMTATLIALAQEDDDASAVRAVLGFALSELDAARLDIVSGDAGPPSTLATMGAGPGSTAEARPACRCVSGRGWLPRSWRGGRADVRFPATAKRCSNARLPWWRRGSRPCSTARGKRPPHPSRFPNSSASDL